MRQSVVYEYRTRQRKNLSLVLQAPERRREHKPVVVSPEIGTRRILFRVMVVFQPEPLVVDKLCPVHLCHIFSVCTQI